jgi:hypothetical protein
MEQVVDRVVKNLTLALDEAREARSTATLLRAAGLTGLATGIFIFLLWGFSRIYRWSWTHLENFERKLMGKIHLKDLTLLEIEQVLFLSRFAVRLVAWTIGLIASYMWLTFSLKRFPYTRAWGESLGGFLLLTFEKLALGIAESLPGIFLVVVIYFITRFVVQMVKASFSRVEKG